MDKKNEIRKKRYKMLQWILGKSLKLDYAISDKRETSISDSTNYGYTPFCEQASRSSRIFKNFRHYNVYRGIVEDVGYDIGVGCWNIIQTKNVSDGVLEECWKNDTVGGAETYFYEGLKKPVAPATMRYAKIMLELKELFGELKNVVEIGVGYGGAEQDFAQIQLDSVIWACRHSTGAWCQQKIFVPVLFRRGNEAVSFY